MDNTIVQVFSNSSFGELRTAGTPDRPEFCAKDVATALGYKNTNDAIKRHCKGVVKRYPLETTGGIQDVSFIGEGDMYRLIASSKLDSAQRFEHWVFDEILPTIRRDGGYMVAKDETPEETMARAFIIAQSTIERQKARINQQSAQIEEMTPKALFADAVAASDGTCLVGELAKMLTQAGFKVGQNRLFKLLRDDGYLGKHGCNRNVPKQRYIEQGLFRIKETAVTHADGHVTLNRTPKCTGKGQRYFLAKYAHAMSIQA